MISNCSAKPTKRLSADSCASRKSLPLTPFRHFCLQKASPVHKRETYKFNAVYGYANRFPVSSESLDMLITRGSYYKWVKSTMFQDFECHL